MTDMRVGVAGLGRMGGAIARRFADAGLAVSGWTRSGVAPAEAAALGIDACASLAELVGGADVIVLSLFDDAAVTAVVRALCAEDLRGMLLVDTSTVDPETLRAEQPAIAAAGAAAIDAPIAGGPEMVRDGAAGMFLGGAAADVERFLPLARILAARVLVAGGPGAGAAAKTVNNMLLLGYWQTLKEALQVGRAAGLPPAMLFELIEASPAATPALLQRLPGLRGESDAVGFSVDGVVKDAATFAGTARRLGVATPALAAARDSFAGASARGLGAADLIVMVRAALDRDA